MVRNGKKKRQPYARKRFGQHFLTDTGVIERIIAGGDVTPEDHIIEIGPGRGALTKPLADQGAALTVVELDWDLAENLRAEYASNQRIGIVEGDILKTDWNSLFQSGKSNKIIANLPYNISSPVFFKMVKYRHQLDSIVIMVQKELADRLQHDGAGKKLKDYGILSIVAGLTFTVHKVCDVPASCFSPPPKVHSTVIRLVPKKTALADEERFFAFIRKAFNNRRKLFTSFLKREHPELYQGLSEKDHAYLTNLRPENLLPDQYLKLFSEHSLLD